MQPTTVDDYVSGAPCKCAKLETLTPTIDAYPKHTYKHREKLTFTGGDREDTTPKTTFHTYTHPNIYLL